MFDPSFSQNRGNRVNLSTSGASSSSSLLESVRAERLQREERVKQERGALRIQRRWRARREGDEVRREILDRLDELVASDVRSSEEVERRARGLVVMSCWKRGNRDQDVRVDRMLVGLVKSGREIDPGELPSSPSDLRSGQAHIADRGIMRLLVPLSRDKDYIYILAILQLRLLRSISADPT